MRRRGFLSGFGGTAAAWLLITSATFAFAQSPNHIYRLGHLGNSLVSESDSRLTILPELAISGFVEGRNLTFEGRIGNPDAMPGLMRELLDTHPDAIIAVGPTAAVAAHAATQTVPIVVLTSNALELGLAQSFARPGGNITGVVILARELEVKRLSILHEAIPHGRRVAAFVPAAGDIFSETEMRAAAERMGIELLIFKVAKPADYPGAFAAIRSANVQALLIAATPEFYRDVTELSALALEARLPTICEWAEMARAGCLIGYGPNRPALRRRMASQIAAIFRGEAPGDVPIEQPTIFGMAINEKTAKALGFIFPDAVLFKADEVIE